MTTSWARWLIFAELPVGFDQNDKFVATLAGDGIAFAQQSAEAVGGFDQQQVADPVSEGIVDLLEAVEVDENSAILRP